MDLTFSPVASQQLMRSICEKKRVLMIQPCSIPEVLLPLLLFCHQGQQHVYGFIWRSSSSDQMRTVARDARLTRDSRGCGPFMILQAAPKYVRWQSTPDGWAMQTAVTTFEVEDRNNSSTKTNASFSKDSVVQNRLELHSQLHFGDFDYFNYYNSAAFNRGRTILYELLVDEYLLTNYTTADEEEALATTQLRCVTIPLSAAPADQATAKQYGWSCQVDVIGYNQSNWIHADLTRQEFLASTAQQRPLPHTEAGYRAIWNYADPWSVAVPAPASEAATALLVGPPILNGEFVQRRLFSNLFVPGDSFAQFLRAMLWFTVPCPELSILLLDWSSLLSDKVTGPSQIAMSFLQSLITARFDILRQFMFGQIVVASNQISKGGTQYNLLVHQRNQKALAVLEATRQALPQKQRSENSGKSSLALLFGCSHCPDLHQKLIQEYGYRPIQTEWRTAWTIKLKSEPIPKHRRKVTEKITSIVLVVLTALYLAVGGLDWIATVDAAVAANDSAVDRPVAALAYLVRHLLLYVGLSKLLLDWETPGEISQ